MVAFLELVGLALGSASLFGLIVGVFSVYNGRATRKLILEGERATHKLIVEGEQRTHTLIEDIKNILEKNTAILDKNTAILEKLATKLLT